MRQLTLQADGLSLGGDGDGLPRTGSSGLAPSPDGRTMAWRALTPEAEAAARRERQQSYGRVLQEQIAQRQQGGGAEGRAGGYPQYDTHPPTRRGQLAGRRRPDASPSAAAAAEEPACAGPAVGKKVEPRPYAMDAPASPAYAPASPAYAPEPEPTPGMPLRFEQQTPSPLPEGSPRRLHSVALLPQHEQEERHAKREKQNAAAAELRAQMAQNEERRLHQLRLRDEQALKEELADQRAAAEMRSSSRSPTLRPALGRAAMSHDETPVGRAGRAAADAAKRERSESPSLRETSPEEGATGDDRGEVSPTPTDASAALYVHDAEDAWDRDEEDLPSPPALVETVDLYGRTPAAATAATATHGGGRRLAVARLRSREQQAAWPEEPVRSNSAESLPPIPRPSALPRTPRGERDFDRSFDSSGSLPLAIVGQLQPAASSTDEQGSLQKFLRHMIVSDDRRAPVRTQGIPTTPPFPRTPLTYRMPQKLLMNPGAVRAMLESIDRNRSGVIEDAEFQHAMELGAGLSASQSVQNPSFFNRKSPPFGLLTCTHKSISRHVFDRLLAFAGLGG